MASLFPLLKSIKGSLFGLDKDGYFGGRGLRDNVTDGSTSVTIESYGITQFGATAAKTYSLDDPVPGVKKTLACTLGTSTTLQTINASSGATFGGTNTIAKFDTGDTLTLVGLTTALWAVIGNNGSVALSTS